MQLTKSGFLSVLAFIGGIPQSVMTLALVAFMSLMAVPFAGATDDLFTTITTEVTSDAAKVVTFSVAAIAVTVAFYLWGLGRKSINKAK